MKAVPKIPKSKSLFKFFSWFDLAYLSVFAIICAVILAANMGGVKYIIAISLAAFCGVTLLRKEGVSIARSVVYFFQSLMHPSVYTKSDGTIKALQNVVAIEDGVVKFSNNIHAAFIDIPEVNFIALSDTSREILERSLGKCFNAVNPVKTLSLIKTERLVDFTPHIEQYGKLIKRVRGSAKFSQIEKKKRTELLKSKVEQLNRYQGAAEMTVYHLVLRAGSREQLDTLISETLAELNGCGIPARLATAQETAIVLKKQYFGNVDMDELKQLISVKPTENRGVSAKKSKIAIISNDLDGADNETKICETLADWILPNEVCAKNRYCEIDGKRVRTLAIKALPNFVDDAWLAQLCNMPGVNVSINVGWADKGKATKRIDKAYYAVGDGAENTARLSEVVVNGAMQSSMEGLLSDMTYDADKLINIDMYVTFLAETKLEKEVIRHINDLKMQYSTCIFQQLRAFSSAIVRPIAKPSKVYQQLLTVQLLGMGFPMIFPNLLEVGGDLIGVNKYGMPIIADFNKRDGKMRINSNMCVFGASGSGKTYFLSLYALLSVSRGAAVYIIDPENEYSALARRMGGEVIDLSVGEFKINPLHVFADGESGLGAVSSHLGMLKTFYSTVFDLDSERLLILQDLTQSLYDACGITDSVNVHALSAEDFPTFDDLFKHLEECVKAEKDEFMLRGYKRLRLYVKSLTQGQYGALWNGKSTLAHDSNFVTFNAQALLAGSNLAVANAQMLLLARFIIVQLINNYQKKQRGEKVENIATIFDEVHRFLDPKMTVTIDMLAAAAKQYRKYNGALIVASQSVLDLTATEQLLSKTKAVLTESQMNMLFTAKSTHIPDIRRIYSASNLTEQEYGELTSMGRGNTLAMFDDFTRLQINITTNPLEQKYINK